MRTFNHVKLPQLDFDLKAETTDSGRLYATPTGEKYLFLERVFLNLAQSEFPLMSIAQIDLLIWMKQLN
jgi:thermostable 8-oxoguanine DNA glycosylase